MEVFVRETNTKCVATVDVTNNSTHVIQSTAISIGGSVLPRRGDVPALVHLRTDAI